MELQLLRGFYLVEVFFTVSFYSCIHQVKQLS